MKCPNCGAEIGNNNFCEYCGTQVSLDMKKEQEQLNKQGCPKCGSSNIQFKRENQGELRGKNSRQVIHRTVGFCKDCGYTWYPDGANEGPKKNNLIWWILGWVFFFPAPVMVLIWRKKNTWDLKVKIGVTVAFWVLFFVLGSCGNNDNASTTTKDNTVENEIITEEESSVQTEDTDQADNTATESESAEAGGYDAVDKCYEELIANNNTENYNDFSKQVRELTEKYGLYQDSKNNGLGVRYMKIATSRDEAKIISNGDLEKGTYYIRIVADFSKGSPQISLVDNRDGVGKSVDDAVTEEKTTSANEDVIYELNDGINEYINSFNSANPDDAITKEMAQPYNHHGTDHENQIKYYVDDFEVVISSGTEVYIGYTSGTTHTNDEYKEMYSKYLKGFDLGLDDSEIEADWETIMNDLTHNVKFEKYSADVYMPNDKITYMTITKKN